MDNVQTVLPAESNLVLKMTGFLEDVRICREYPVVAWGVTKSQSPERFSVENRYVLPIVISGGAFPVTLEELNDDLKLEGVEGIRYTYCKNGEPAYKSEVVKEPLKRLF